MSASPEKKVSRSEKRRQEEEKERRSIALYSTIGIIVAVAAVVLLVWNSGLLQRNLTALSINGEKYTAADVQYYYNSVYSSYASQYAFDPNVSVKKQKVGSESATTWFDFLMDEARDRLIDNNALAAKAKEEGHTLSTEAQQALDSFVLQLDTAWMGYGYTSRDDFVKANYGPYMTYSRLVELASMEYLASDYAQTRLDAIEHPSADYEAYYKEHADELDTIVYSQFAFRAYVPTADEQGNPIEMTDEEKSAKLEAQKTEQKALAEEAKSKLEGGAKPEDIAREYEDKAYSSSVSQRAVGSNVSLYSSSGGWLLDSARKAGDVTLTESESGTAYYYYVAVFEDRLRDEEPTHTLRSIPVQAGDGIADPTSAQFSEAEDKAQSLLDEWKAGDATEDSFAALATANSASNGGLISNITSSSSQDDAVKDWALDSARKAGDTELVKTDTGWSVVYYVSGNDPVWRQAATTGLQNQDYEQLTSGAREGRDAVWGMGLNLVSP